MRSSRLVICFVGLFPIVGAWAAKGQPSDAARVLNAPDGAYPFASFSCPGDSAKMTSAAQAEVRDYLAELGDDGRARAAYLQERARRAPAACEKVAAEAKARADAYARTNHLAQCRRIVFSEVACANERHLIEYSQLPYDPPALQDILARNPVRCWMEYSGARGIQPHNAPRPQYLPVCGGCTMFRNKTAYQPERTSFYGESFYFVQAPVDFDTGRRDMLLAIRGYSARCDDGR